MTFYDRKDYIKNNPYTTKENCQFCKVWEWEEGLLLYKTKYWEIRFNKFPYYWYKQNLLAFLIRHIAYTYELKKEELEDFINVEIFMKDYFWEKNYFSFIRQWTWWRSVEHIHYHYLEWIFIHSKENEKLFEVIN